MNRRSKINRTNVTEHLLKYQLKMINKTFNDVDNNPDWHIEWSITKEQEIKFRGYAIPLLKKIFKFNKTKAEETFEWFFMHWGLKIENYEFS